jgi:hypothetical protein
VAEQAAVEVVPLPDCSSTVLQVDWSGAGPTHHEPLARLAR